MATKAQIIETMARCLHEHMWPNAPWESMDHEYRKTIIEQESKTLDAAFPLIQAALAEQVRFTDADWREYQAIPDQGYSRRHWLDHRAARLIEGVTL